MGIELKVIPVRDFVLERNKIFSLAERIWTRAESSENFKHSIERWGNSGTESGEYFYIMQGREEIGITGYFIPDLDNGIFGLRHHGVSVPRAAKIALDLLVGRLKEEYGYFAKELIELIPRGREELIGIFTSFGFEFSDMEVPDWEPKKDYYRYVMVRRL